MNPTFLEAERPGFERWAASAGFNIDRDDSDKYLDYHRSTTRWAWEAWVARAVEAGTEQPKPNGNPCSVSSPLPSIPGLIKP